jgi:hypothetical protein
MHNYLKKIELITKILGEGFFIRKKPENDKPKNN